MVPFGVTLRPPQKWQQQQQARVLRVTHPCTGRMGMEGGEGQGGDTVTPVLVGVRALPLAMAHLQVSYAMVGFLIAMRGVGGEAWEVGVGVSPAHSLAP